MKQKKYIHIMRSHGRPYPKMNGKFEVFDHEPCPRACGPTVLNFYKKQMKSEKCEICNDIMISYVDAMVKI